MLLFVLGEVAWQGRNPLNIIQPGAEGPSIVAIQEDFPGFVAPHGTGLDGQQFYAIARDPIHLDRTSRHLDGPRYRLQRPLFPWLAFALHPFGGGLGLVRAFLIVGVVAIFLGSLATGALSASLGGPSWLGIIFALLPGAYMSLRTTTADTLAVALATTAIVASLRGRNRVAVAAACLSVLAKEPSILVLAGWFAYRRDRRSIVLVLAPLALAGAWAVWLHLAVPSGVSQERLGLPLVGVADAIAEWARGRELLGMFSTLGAIVMAAITLWHRGFRHPIGWVVAIHLAFTAVLSANVIGLDFSGPRSTMALLLFSVVALATPTSQARHAGP